MTAGFYFVASSNVGLIRNGNEDSGLASNQVIAVADGMGGHAAGEVASATVIQNLFKALPALPVTLSAGKEWLLNEIDTANNSLSDIIVERPETRGMGTTLSAVVAVESKVLIGHVGDSRVYRIRGDEITQLTKDHTYVQMLVDNGEITLAEAERHPRRNLMIRAIDGIHELQVDIQIEDVLPGDRFLVCSDGLSGLVNSERIKQVVTSSDLTQASNQLIEFALAAGAPDNVTVVLAEYQLAPFPSDAFMVGSAAEAENLGTEISNMKAKRSRIWPWVSAAGILLLGITGLVGWWNQQWYVGIEDKHIVIFHGIPQDIFGVRLSILEKRSEFCAVELNELDTTVLERGLIVDDYEAALALMAELENRLIENSIGQISESSPCVE